MNAARSSKDYRPDIDGLRAIAVLSVMIFHANDAALPGGFVGVDIFFVISGYLISKHIAAEVIEGRFSLVEFYRRRIRRIVPMMMTVVAVTLVVSLFVMTPEDARAVAKSAVWSIASMANVHFWRDLDTSYFANSSAEVPLLHLWSLGVEEQFYLLWPLVLALGVRKVQPVILLVIATVVAGISFELASGIYPSDASFAYYMLPTRMGELLLGALVGIMTVVTPWQLGPHGAKIAAWLGTALVAASLWAIDRHDPFPGWLALPPTLGAALMILAGERRPNPIPGLASLPMVFVGRISYSAYLWHWPLFAFFRYGYGEPGVLASIAILMTTMLLAWISFEIVERPTRSSAAPFRTVAMRQFALPAIALLVPSLMIVYATRMGLPVASSSYLTQLERVREAARPALSFDWTCQRQRLSKVDIANPRCVLGAPSEAEPRVLLWGDSNAAHYVPMVSEFAARAGVRFRNFEVGSCPPLFTDPEPYVEARRLSDCRHSAATVRAEVERYPVVLISAAWSAYSSRSPNFIQDVSALVSGLSERGQTIILIGKAPEFPEYERRCEEKALRVPFKNCPDASAPLSVEIVRVNDQLQALAERTPNVHYFDANRYLCPAGNCSTRAPNGLRRYYDASHLTVSASAELGRAVLAEEGVPAAFSAIYPEPTQ